MDGVVHPNVEQAIGRDRIRKALKRYENRPADEHRYGIVRSVNEDGSYEVLLDGDVQTSRCAQYGTALVGDRVLAVTKKDGINDLLGRLGGEPVDPTIEERFEKLESEAVVASGTSGVWEYIKFENGLAICSCNWHGTEAHYAGPYASLFYGYVGEIAYPFAFASRPNAAYTLQIGSGFSVPAGTTHAFSADDTSTKLRWLALATVSGNQPVYINAVVMGRWK